MEYINYLLKNYPELLNQDNILELTNKLSKLSHLDNTLGLKELSQNLCSSPMYNGDTMHSTQLANGQDSSLTSGIGSPMGIESDPNIYLDYIINYIINIVHMIYNFLYSN